MLGSAGAPPRLAKLGCALGLWIACGCQTVFGDFEITPAPTVSPRLELGTACEPDQYRCTNEVLETCNDERTGFVKVETCASAAECNSGARRCRLCTPGEHQCRGSVLESCDATSSWVAKGEPCAAPEACSIAPDRMSGMCAPTMCVAGKHECVGATLKRCAPGMDHSDAIALCDGPELCDATYADQLADAGGRGACHEAACAPDAWSCDGATLRHCAWDRTGWDVEATCESPALCNVTQAACAACNPGDVECNGAELRRCDASGWARIKTCASAALCDAETVSCLAAECNEPGRLRCGREGFPVLERCSNELRWEVVEACATVELCSEAAGRCLAPACAAGTKRCLGQRVQACSQDQTRWDTIATCGEGEICDAKTGCGPGPCAEGTLRCNGPGLEQCVSGRFEETARCATAELCHADSGSCEAPACPPGPQFDCPDNSPIISKCTPGRNAYVEFRTCGGDTTCDATPALGTGLPECDVCKTPNAYRCDGMDLLRCAADGQSEPKVDRCGTTCSVGADKPTCD